MNSSLGQKKLGQVLLFLLIFLSCYKIIFSQLIDPDGYWHILSGKNLLIDIVNYDNYYWSDVTQNYSDQKHTWLGDVLLYLIYHAGQENLLVITKGIFLFACVWFLFLCSNREPNFFKLLVLISVCVCIQQKLFVRNSLFAIVFLPCILYLLSSKKYLLIIPFLFGWAQVHGSFVMGIGVVFLHIFGDLLLADKKTALLSVISLVIIFTIFYFTSDLFQGYVLNYKDIITGKLFKNSESIDFQSPFKYGRLYAYFCVGILIATIALVRFKIPAYILILNPVVIYGLQYDRMIGYIGIVCAYILIDAEKKGLLRQVDKFIYGFLFCVMLFSIQVYDYRYRHTGCDFGFEKSPIRYPSVNHEVLLKDHQFEDTWNTIGIGGFLLLNWHPQKKVYIDTHWAPHGQDLYEKYNTEVLNPDSIKADSAIMGLHETETITRFGNSEKWHAYSIDRGSVIFLTRPCDLSIKLDQADIDKMTNLHKQLLTKALLACKAKVTVNN